MSSWRTFRLGDALEIKHGFAFKGEFFSSDYGRYVVLTPGNFRDEGGFKPKSGAEKFYDGPLPEGYVLSPGDIVVAMTEQVRGLLGSSATIPADAVYLHNQRIGLVHITDPEILDARFVYHLFNSTGVRDQLQATATGSKVRHTAPERIEGVRVPVPDVLTQRRIAEILDSTDDLIGNTERRIALLEQMAQAIHREWFVHFRYPGHEDDELVDSPLGPIPTGWSLTPLGELGPVITESVDPSEVDTGTPAVGLEHIPRRSFTLSEWGRASDLTSRKNRFAAGDVLFGKIRPYFHKVCVAPMDGIASTDAIVVRPVREARGLVTMTMFSDDFVAHAVATSNGTKMPRANWKVLREWLVPIPPDATLSAFEEAVASAVDSCNLLAFQSRTLAELRDLLLPKLVTGDIDVSHIDLNALQEEHAA